MILLANGIAFSIDPSDVPPTFEPLADFPLAIMVGLTGVGKSTVVELLQSQIVFTLLPNRRQITDQVIISALQQADGETPAPVLDRVKRFEYTARYRQHHPGGMAHALGQLLLDPAQVGPRLLFDGLRGLNEVQYAAKTLPRSRFVLLDAPDTVRVSRLLNRADAFDTTQIETPPDQNTLAGLRAIPNIEAIFNAGQLRQIAQSSHAAGYPAGEVVKKISIIVEERRNYDSNTARIFLTHHLPPERVLVVDTATLPPQAVAGRIGEWLG